jgi:hypothetical protein
MDDGLKTGKFLGHRVHIEKVNSHFNLENSANEKEHGERKLLGGTCLTSSDSSNLARLQQDTSMRFPVCTKGNSCITISMR